MPDRSRASIRTACWKPPQVPRNGTPRSRANRAAAIAPSALRYGLPGTTQMPSKPSRTPGPRRPRTGSSTGRRRCRRGGAAPRRAAGTRAWARTLWRAVADERDGGGGSWAACCPRAEFTSNDRSWPASIRDTDAGGSPVPAHVHRRRPAAARSPRRRASSATRSRPSRSTSRCWRPTSARRCCTAGRSRRPRPGTRLFEHAGAILLRLDAARADVARVGRRAAGHARARRDAAVGRDGRARRGRRPRARARRWPPPCAWRRATRSRPPWPRASSTPAIVDGVAAPGDPLPLPETGVPVAEVAEEPLVARAPARASADGPGGRAPRGPRGRPLDRRARRHDAARRAGDARPRRRLPGGAALRRARRRRPARARRRRPRGSRCCPPGPSGAASRSPRRRSCTAPSCSPRASRSRASSRACSPRPCGLLRRRRRRERPHVPGEQPREREERDHRGERVDARTSAGRGSRSAAGRPGTRSSRSRRRR